MESKKNRNEVRKELNDQVWNGFKFSAIILFVSSTFEWLGFHNTEGAGDGINFWYFITIFISALLFITAFLFKPKSELFLVLFNTINVIILNSIWVYPVFKGAGIISSNSNIVLLLPLVVFTLTTVRFLAPLYLYGILSVFLGLFPALLIHYLQSNILVVIQISFTGIAAVAIVIFRYQNILKDIVNHRIMILRTERLRAQYNKHQKYINTQNSGRWRWDIKNNKIHFSKKWIRMFGWPEGVNKENENIWENLIHPEDFHEIYRFWSVFQSGEKDFFEIEHRLKTTYGYKWVLIRGVATDYDSEGNVTEIYGVHVDIDDKKRQEIENSRLLKLLITMMKIRSIITYTENETSILSNICDLLVGEAGFFIAWVSRVIPGSKSVNTDPDLVPLVSAGVSKNTLMKCLEENKINSEIEFKAPVQSAITGKVHYLKPVHNIVEKTNFGDPEYANGIFIPLLLGKKEMYILSLQMKANSVLEGLEIRILEELGDDLAYALINIRNRKNVEKVQTDLHDERNLFSFGPVAAIKWVPFPEVQVKYVSPNISQFGYSADDLVQGKIEINTMIHPEDKEYFWSELKRKYSEEENNCFEMTFRIIDNSGEIRFVKLYNRVIYSKTNLNPGKYFYGYILEISNIINMENHIRNNEKKYNILVENSNDAIVFIEEGKILYINPAGSKITGYPAEKIIGSKIVYWIDRRNRIQVLKDLKKKNRGRWNSSMTNLLIKTKNGPKPVEISTARYIDNDRVSFIAFIRDVTSRQKIENDLKTKIEELELFNRIAVSREIRMIELKRQVNRLMGRKKPYKIAE